MLGFWSCFIWFIYLPGCDCCEQRLNLRTLSYRNSREMQEFLSYPLGETHKNVILHTRKPWPHPKSSSLSLISSNIKQI